MNITGSTTRKMVRKSRSGALFKKGRKGRNEESDGGKTKGGTGN